MTQEGQSAPDIDRLSLLGDIFNVTLDYLIKPSEIDELSIRTEMLEKQQEEIIRKAMKAQDIKFHILSSVAVYLIAMALIFVMHSYFWQLRIPPIVAFSILLIATAIAIFINLKYKKSRRAKE